MASAKDLYLQRHGEQGGLEQGDATPLESTRWRH